MNENNVITSCSSVKSKEEFLHVQKGLTIKANTVISLRLFGHAVWKEGMEEMLDDMYKRKIDIKNEIYVINKGDVNEL